MSTPKADQDMKESSESPECGSSADERESLKYFQALKNETLDAKLSAEINIESTFVFDQQNQMKSYKNLQSRFVAPLNATFDKKEAVLKSTENLINDGMKCLSADVDDVKVSEATFTANEKDPNFTLLHQEKKMNETFDAKRRNTRALNTTFDGPEKPANLQTAVGGLTALNATFDAQKETLNGTFEVVGNGSFIIEGKTTNLMDMESNDLETILTCTPVKKRESLHASATATSRQAIKVG